MKIVHAISGRFECNVMTSKVICKVMVSSGILKNGSIIRECNTEYRLIGTSKRKIT